MENNKLSIETKSKIITGYIHYNESDDLAKIFEILNDFRKNHNLKYSHQSNVNMIFFNINSEYLEELSKVRPFKISKFQSKSEYKCESDVATALMKKKDSFLRMIWNEETKTLEFASRTISKVHSNLIKRVFKDSEQNFNKLNYKVLRDLNQNYSNKNQENDLEEQTQNVNQDKKFNIKPVKNFENKDSFQLVSKKNNKYDNKKIVKEYQNDSKPKVRGMKKT